MLSKSVHVFIDNDSISVCCRMLDESLRWLIANGKLDRARQVIKNACKWNKKDYATVMAAVGFHDEELDKATRQVELKAVTNTADIKGKDTAEGTGEDGKREAMDGEDKHEETTKFIEKDHGPAKVLVQKYTALDIIRNGRILRVSLILWFTW